MLEDGGGKIRIPRSVVCTRDKDKDKKIERGDSQMESPLLFYIAPSNWTQMTNNTMATG